MQDWLKCQISPLVIYRQNQKTVPDTIKFLTSTKTLDSRKKWEFSIIYLKQYSHNHSVVIGQFRVTDKLHFGVFTKLFFWNTQLLNGIKKQRNYWIPN